MDSRRKTGGESARLSDLTRRSVVGAAAAAPVLANAGGVTGDLVDRCGTFVAHRHSHPSSTHALGDLESDVIKNHNWFGISRREQLELPQGQEMARIDKVLPGLFREREKLLKSLPRSAANDTTGVAPRSPLRQRPSIPRTTRRSTSFWSARRAIWPPCAAPAAASRW